jgi:hypothetical protein
MTSGVDALFLALAAWILFVVVSTAALWAVMPPTLGSPLTRFLDTLASRRADVSTGAQSQRKPSWRQAAAALLVAAGVALTAQWLVIDSALATPGTSPEARDVLFGELVLAGLWIGFLVLQWAMARRVA